MKVAKAVPTTYLGSPELHKKHRVMIEPGIVPRARVMDQAPIDELLLSGHLDLKQHRAAEYLIQQAVMSGTYPRGVNLEGASTSGGVSDFVPHGIEPFSRTLRAVRKHLSEAHERIVREVVLMDSAVTGRKELGMLQAALICIADKRMGYKSDPVRWIKKKTPG